jgi:uncharacterized cupredoxin-like copper-binding protein
MNFRHFAASLTIAISMFAPAAHADSVVNVTLIDKSAAFDPSKPMDFAMGTHADMTKAPMGINVNPKSVSPGMVKFNVTNLAGTLVHEVIIARVKDENTQLPYLAGQQMVNEEAVRTLGEVAEINPSRFASLTIEMTPGKYVLYCNLPGHFMAGMWTVMEVK